MTPTASSQRTAAAIASLNHFVPIVRQALVSDPAFTDRYGLSVSSILTIGPGVSFARADLVASMNDAFGGKTDTTVADTEGGLWSIKLRREPNETTIALNKDERSLVGVQLAFLSPDDKERVRSFEAEAHRVNLPADIVQRATALLTAGQPTVDELMSLVADLGDTPLAKQRALEESFRHQSVPFELFAPRSERYYERLIGKLSDGQSFNDYIAQVAEPHMRALVEYNPFEGYLLALLVSGSQSLGISLSKVKVEDADLIRVYDWLVDHGDMLSRAAAIEAALLHEERPEPVKQALERLLHTMVTPPAVGAVEPYELFSAVFILVYGAMAHTRTLVDKPPFWRRLAAMAHAAMIARAVMKADIDVPAFVKFAKDNRTHAFLMQCYCDLRAAPRWIPEFALSKPMRHELGGRVFHAATAKEQAVTAAGWKGLLLDDVPGGLRSQLDLRQAFFAGPLEGGSAAVLEIPENNLAEVRSSLSQPAITAASFSALANCAILFRVPDDICDLAAGAIARADYHLANADEATPLIPHLLGLATAAAVTRSQKLADAVIVVVRKYRRLYPEALEVESAFRIVMHAGASRADLTDWCKCIGDALTDLSFQDISEESAVRLHAHIVLLCEIVPELWATCGQAEAALRSIANA